MGIDRGLGDLKITCVVSRHSADWDEIIEWDLDDPGVGFKENGNVFDMRTTFLTMIIIS